MLSVDVAQSVYISPEKSFELNIILSKCFTAFQIFVYKISIFLQNISDWIKAKEEIYS